MDLIRGYNDSETESDENEHDQFLRTFHVAVGGNELENSLTSHQLLKEIDLVRYKRDIKKKYITPKEDDNKGKEKQRLIKAGLDKDSVAVYWTIYCPGKGTCKRVCGGIGTCDEGCISQRKRHDRHNCQVSVTAKIMLSDETKWNVCIRGSHTDSGSEWSEPTGNRKILERVKDNIMVSRSYGLKPFEVFRRQIKDLKEPDMETEFKDTRTNPTDKRVVDFIKNTEKRHSFSSGQWTAVHHLAVNELRNSGQLLLYQKGNAEEAAMDDIDRGYVLAVSNQSALLSARKNQAVLGIDGKHGLQEDGAALMTAITQHKDGFGCPTSFTIMSRENSDNIFNALRAIKENVPCPDDECDQPFRYFELPNNQGYRRVTQCSMVQEYKPLVMIDKFEASANACQRLELTYVLCWFHLVKAVMEKLTHESVSLHDSYLIILGFKIVARAVSEERACERWQMFLQSVHSKQKHVGAVSSLTNKIDFFIYFMYFACGRSQQHDQGNMPCTMDVDL
ncbi:unnamed protein product [Mytilus edulis]|uniref:MULE transposase domain-containing protein n=1 Tax=Mytilus edulis TaxID=6550 RepID=A0A8S3Q039_MYTED|nr:unnamed protein product [Mytilus edulis]